MLELSKRNHLIKIVTEVEKDDSSQNEMYWLNSKNIKLQNSIKNQ